MQNNAVKISLGAKAVSYGMRFLVCASTALTGQSLMYTSMMTQKPPYRFGRWTPPKGYANHKIDLPNACGYLLQKEGRHSKKVVYQIHGGGFVATFSDLYNKTALHFSRLTGDADVFSVDYRTAPDNVYPAALQDAVDGYEWLLQRYQPQDILLCGESAGGGLCLALTLWLRDHNKPMPKTLVLSSPWTDMAAEGESYRTKKTEDMFFGHPNPAKVPAKPVATVYAAQADPHDPYLSPAYGEYSGFPPMLIQTGEAELLLSDSDTVVRQAKTAGVDVRYYTYPGMYHTFYITHPNLPESKQAWKRIEDWVTEKYK